MSRQFEFLENSRAPSFITKNSVFKGEIGRNRSMKRCHLINGSDETLIDQNGPIISHPSDQLSKVEMSPRIVCEETCRLISCVGS